MFEKLVRNLIADIAPRLVPQVLRSLADQIESGQISFSEEAINQAAASAATSAEMSAAAAQLATAFATGQVEP